MTMTSDSQVPTSTRATDRLAMAHDASHFLLAPASVATPRDGGRRRPAVRGPAARAGCR